jgi:hypothetical protein
VSKRNNENISNLRFFPLATGVNDTGGASWARISPQIYEEIQNGPNGIIRGLGETDPCRKPEVENLVALSL